MNAVESNCYNRLVNLIHSAEIQYLSDTNIYLNYPKLLRMNLQLFYSIPVIGE